MSKPAQPILLYGFKISGHSHRAELMLRLLDLPYEFRLVDLPGGEQKTERFLRLNPFGTVPVIDDGGTVVADSVAILVYLALKYDESRRWLPAEPAAAAAVQRWLSAAQGPVAYGPALCRFIKLFGAPMDHARAAQIAQRFLGVLESQLQGREYLVGSSPTIADVAIYSYVSVAPEGEISLEPYRAIRAWLDRIARLPRFEPMPVSKPKAA